MLAVVGMFRILSMFWASVASAFVGR